MAAPKGNQFWKLRSKHGRAKLFASPKLMWEAAQEYFQWCDKNPWYRPEQLKKPTVVKDKDGNIKLESMVNIPTARPYTLSGLCLYLNASESFWRKFRSNPKLKQGFFTVIEKVEEIINTQQFEGATVGAFNATIISRKQGLADKVETKNTNINHNSEPLSKEKIKEIYTALDKEV